MRSDSWWLWSYKWQKPGFPYLQVGEGLLKRRFFMISCESRWWWWHDWFLVSHMHGWDTDAKNGDLMIILCILVVNITWKRPSLPPTRIGDRTHGREFFHDVFWLMVMIIWLKPRFPTVRMGQLFYIKKLFMMRESLPISRTLMIWLISGFPSVRVGHRLPGGEWIDVLLYINGEYHINNA